ncbi:MAG: LPS-assembly protein LptD, partial [Armatimonadota bacterium]
GTLLIPIKGLGTKIIPQAGSSADEGLFLKTAYAYTATSTQTGVLKLDLMTKKGVGIGVNQTYRAGDMNGKASIYYLNDRSIGGTNITGNLDHQQKFGDINLNLTSNYRQNSYLFFPATTSQDNQLSLNRSSKTSSSSLSIRSSSNRGNGISKDSAVSLRQMQQLSDTLSASVTVDMRSNFSTGMSASDKELETAIDLISRTDRYDLTLSSNFRDDLDGNTFTGDNQYSNLEKLPELNYQTDSYRLGNKGLLGLPFRLSLSAGNYHEMPSGVTNGRVYSRLDLLEKPIDISSRNELSISSAISQAYYANDMMQYVLKLNSMLTTRYSDYLKSRFSWSYQQPNGYSPFRFDYTSKYNFTRAIFDYQDSGKLRWSLSSGYNINRSQAPWQDLALRATAHPARNTAVSLLTGYDFNLGRWKTLTNQVQFTSPKKLIFDIGTRYNTDKGKVELMRGRFDVYAGKKWRLEGIASWNGITNAFDYKAFRVTRDLHCWDVSVTYNDETGFRQDRGISLDFHIKALPKQDRFGIGQFGQMVDTSMGECNY